MQGPGKGGHGQQTSTPSSGEGYDGSTGLWVGLGGGGKLGARESATQNGRDLAGDGGHPGPPSRKGGGQEDNVKTRWFPCHCPLRHMRPGHLTSPSLSFLVCNIEVKQRCDGCYQGCLSQRRNSAMRSVGQTAGRSMAFDIAHWWKY